jgi:hypothetical protein
VISNCVQSDCDDDVDDGLIVGIQPSGRSTVTVPRLLSYQYRPAVLDNMNLYEFTRWFYKRKITDAELKNVTRNKYPLDCRHPQSQTHCLTLRKLPLTPSVFNDYYSPLATTDHYKVYHGYISAQVLFRPWRSESDLDSWAMPADAERHFKEFEASAPPAVKRWISNYFDLHKSAVAAKRDRHLRQVERQEALKQMGSTVVGQQGPSSTNPVHGFPPDDDDDEGIMLPLRPDARDFIAGVLWDIDWNANKPATSTLNPTELRIFDRIDSAMTRAEEPTAVNNATTAAQLDEPMPAATNRISQISSAGVAYVRAALKLLKKTVMPLLPLVAVPPLLPVQGDIFGAVHAGNRTHYLVHCSH